MNSFINELCKLKLPNQTWKSPLRFDLSSEGGVQKLKHLYESDAIERVFDATHAMFEELYDISHPDKKDSKKPHDITEFAKLLAPDDYTKFGEWVYYPWSGNLVHFPPKEELRQLRTSRNRNLITEAEQKKLYKKTIVIIGLSVGSSAVEMLVSQGIGGKLVLVDMDQIDPTNLNRIKVPFHEVGTHKVDVLAKKISEIDPYIEQVHYKNGMNDKSLVEIIELHKPDIIIDEMDSLEMKIKLREKAKENGIPVLMATDNGDNVLLDIERFDQDKNLPIFHGLIPEEILVSVMKGKLSRPQTGLLIGQYFVGFHNVPLRMLKSLPEVGVSLPSWPQLAGAATLSGILLAYSSRKLILEEPIKSGRHIYNIDVIDPVVNSPEYQSEKQEFLDHLPGSSK